MVAASATCKNLIIEPDAELIIANGSTLTVLGHVRLKGSENTSGTMYNIKNLKLNRN
jgi:hypothetical protein